jgi:hypothetical protein
MTNVTPQPTKRTGRGATRQAKPNACDVAASDFALCDGLGDDVDGSETNIAEVSLLVDVELLVFDSDHRTHLCLVCKVEG